MKGSQPCAAALVADEFRKRGLEVIESYPGAAQDILGIPRKGSSLEELKWGLSRAGIDGQYLTGRVTHDEVDAVTSALVGLFYLAGDYIALGTPSEDYLIVPRSPKIKYLKLAQILAATGLDAVTNVDGSGLECKLDAKPALAYCQCLLRLCGSYRCWQNVSGAIPERKVWLPVQAIQPSPRRLARLEITRPRGSPAVWLGDQQAGGRQVGIERPY